MAMVVYMCGEEKSRKSSFRADRKPWMLKDYLGDDMSSCSSNGFRSFPRRQCCVAVRNLIEKEVIGSRRNNHYSKPAKRMITRNRSISSTLQKASMAVINAVKFLPFNNPVKNSLKSSDGKSFLSRSFSKKLFRRSFFWKKEKTTTNSVMVVKKRKNGDDDDEIERWISSGVVGTEKYQPLDLSNDTTTVTNVSTTSVSNYSDGKSESSWFDDVTFTSDSSENDVVERREKMEVEGEKEVSKRVGGITGQDSVEPAVLAKGTKWLNVEAEKEQSSPISVLDFPYNDESGSSPFTIRASKLKGTKERLMKKLGRFECLASLETVSFETLMSSTFIEDQSSKCSIRPCSTPSYVLSSESDEEEEDEEESHENEVEKQAQDLLNITKAKIPTKITHKIEFENLLLDFFRENITKKTSSSSYLVYPAHRKLWTESGEGRTYVTLLNAAEDWLNGHYDKLILGWEVKDKRQAYIKDMEDEGWWPRDTNLQKEEVTFKLGEEVLANLIEELIVEF